MSFNELTALLTPAQITRAMECESAFQLKSALRAQDVELSDEQSDEVFELLNPEIGKLDDDILEFVIGGGI